MRLYEELYDTYLDEIERLRSLCVAYDCLMAEIKQLSSDASHDSATRVVELAVEASDIYDQIMDINEELSDMVYTAYQAVPYRMPRLRGIKKFWELVGAG